MLSYISLIFLLSKIDIGLSNNLTSILHNNKIVEIELGV